MLGSSVRLLFVLQFSLLFLGYANAFPVAGRRSYSMEILRRAQVLLDAPTSFTTTDTVQVNGGPMTESCNILMTPIKGQNGEDLVQMEKTCTLTALATDPPAGGTPPPPAASTPPPSDTGSATASAPPPSATDSAPLPPSSAPSAPSDTSAPSPGTTLTVPPPGSSAPPAPTDSATPASATGTPAIGVNGFSTVVAASVATGAPSATGSGTASPSSAPGTPSATPSATGSAIISVNGFSSIPASAVPTNAPSAPSGTAPTAAASTPPVSAASSPSETPTSASATSTDVSGAAAANGTSAADSAASASSTPFELPGKKISVLPIGLGVFAGISVIALIVVGLVTYERTKYRKAFRQRKLAEAGANMGYGGMAQRV